MDTALGYRHPRYARSLAEFGRPRELPRCGGWVLERPIDGTTWRDAMGCYPLFCCADPTQLDADLSALGADVVSLTLVTDPLGGFADADLRRCFDHVAVHGQHYVAELDRPLERFVSRSHLATARRALRRVSVELCTHPSRHLDEWTALYGELARRHGLRGLKAFSRDAFAAQLETPGLVMFRATAAGETVCLDLWFADRETAYGHLVATSARGYALQASYATKLAVLEHFAGRVQWVDFGGVPAGAADSGAGLAAFKRGWASTTRPAYLCGRIFAPQHYAHAVAAHGAAGSGYFPAYRAGELL